MKGEGMTSNQGRRFVAVCLFLSLPWGVGCHPENGNPGRGHPCSGYYEHGTLNTEEAEDWCRSGSSFVWPSTLPENEGRGLLIYYNCRGERSNPAILFIHGWPTSSYDFRDLFQRLSGDFFVCTLDTPGYGFSDKPGRGFAYSIFDDARLVDYFIREIAGLRSFALFTHDKGDSVGFAFLKLVLDDAHQDYHITHHFITNGNIYLPLARLTVMQKVLLDPMVGPGIARWLTGQTLAIGLGLVTYSPPLNPLGPEVRSIASILDYQDGTNVLNETIHYLDERAVHEEAWLRLLGQSPIDTTLIWGELDSIAPPEVADYVWSEYLAARRAPSDYWRLPCANHYLQYDRPADLDGLIRMHLLGDEAAGDPEGVCAPRLVASSYARRQ